MIGIGNVDKVCWGKYQKDEKDGTACRSCQFFVNNNTDCSPKCDGLPIDYDEDLRNGA